MDVFTYVASSNPYQSKAILHKYGYSAKNIQTADDLGQCLKKLVTYEGEDAMKDIINSHPDKGLIIESYESEKKTEQHSNFNGQSCNCNQCRTREHQYMNFAGNDAPSKSVMTTNVFILVSALLLASAIIVKK